MYQKYDHIYYIDKISCRVKRGTVVRGLEATGSYPARYDLVVGFCNHFCGYAEYEHDFAWEDDIYLTEEEANAHLLEKLDLDSINDCLEEAEKNYNYYKDLKAKFEVK